MALTRFNNQKDANTFDGKAINSNAVDVAFAATVEVPVPTRKALRHYLTFAQLTGVQLVNGTNIGAVGVNFDEGDEVYLMFSCDATSRTITWGAAIRAGVAATMVLPISGSGIAKCIYWNGKLQIVAQSVAAT